MKDQKDRLYPKERLIRAISQPNLYNAASSDANESWQPEDQQDRGRSSRGVYVTPVRRKGDRSKSLTGKLHMRREESNLDQKGNF